MIAHPGPVSSDTGHTRWCCAKCLSKLEPETGGWTIFAEETEATDLRVAAKINDQNFELMVVERIDPSTGEVAVFAIR